MGRAVSPTTSVRIGGVGETFQLGDPSGSPSAYRVMFFKRLQAAGASCPRSFARSTSSSRPRSRSSCRFLPQPSGASYSLAFGVCLTPLLVFIISHRRRCGDASVSHAPLPLCPRPPHHVPFGGVARSVLPQPKWLSLGRLSGPPFVTYRGLSQSRPFPTASV